MRWENTEDLKTHPSPLPSWVGEFFQSAFIWEQRWGKDQPTRWDLSILGLPNEVSYHQGFIQGIMLGLQPTKIPIRYHLCPQEAWGQLRSEYLWADSVWYLLLQVYTKCNGSNIDHLSVARNQGSFYITGIIQAQNGRMSKCLPEDKWSDITIERTKDEASGEVKSKLWRALNFIQRYLK